VKIPGHDGCGCFPTGRHYPGIAHLLSGFVRWIAEEFSADTPWDEIPIALLDTETTGVDASIDRVIEVGIVVGQGGVVVARHSWLIDPGVPIPKEATAIHGISDADVEGKPRFSEVAREIAEALTQSVPGAYNANFDRHFIVNEFARAQFAPPAGTLPPALRKDVDWVDPLVWARELQREEKSKALGEVAQRLGISLDNAHRASDDAEAALRVLYALGKDARVPRTYGALIQEQRRLAQVQADERRRWRS
jgi:DNA polymerase III subunit epsilon